MRVEWKRLRRRFTYIAVAAWGAGIAAVPSWEGRGRLGKGAGLASRGPWFESRGVSPRCCQIATPAYVSAGWKA